MRYCSVCGNLVDENAKFCDNCGNKLPEVKSVSTQSVQVEPSFQKSDDVASISSADNKPKKCSNAFSIISLVFMVLTNIFIRIFGMTGLSVENAIVFVLLLPIPLIALVFAIIGLVKGIKTRNVASIVMSAISLFLFISIIITEVFNMLIYQITLYDSGIFQQF